MPVHAAIHVHCGGTHPKSPRLQVLVSRLAHHITSHQITSHRTVRGPCRHAPELVEVGVEQPLGGLLHRHGSRVVLGARVLRELGVGGLALGKRRHLEDKKRSPKQTNKQDILLVLAGHLTSLSRVAFTRTYDMYIQATGTELKSDYADQSSCFPG